VDTLVLRLHTLVQIDSFPETDSGFVEQMQFDLEVLELEKPFAARRSLASDVKRITENSSESNKIRP